MNYLFGMSTWANEIFSPQTLATNALPSNANSKLIENSSILKKKVCFFNDKKLRDI